MIDNQHPPGTYNVTTIEAPSRFVRLIVEKETKNGNPSVAPMWINIDRVVALGPAGDATTWLLLAGAPRDQWIVRGEVGQVVDILNGVIELP